MVSGVFLSSLLLFAGDPTDTLSSNTLFGQEVRQVAPLTELQLQQRQTDFQQMLDEKGLVLLGDQVRPGNKADGFTQNPAPVADWTTPPHRNTIFLNFFGASLSPGSNAALNESPCVNSPMDYPGFGGSESQALALNEVFERLMEPYGVRIAYDEVPPPELPYAMVMMGGLPGLLGLPNGVLGVSCSSDCGDNWWRDATFAFTDAINPNNSGTLGTTALHEAAHAFGLAHIGDPSKVMNPFVGSGNVTWAPTCVPYDDATGGINCQATHDEFCDGGAQNSDAELMAYFGANSPDMEAPTVSITTPADGAEVAAGGTVTIEADVEDNHEGVGWKLVVDDGTQVQESVAFTFQRRWDLSNLAPGTYTARVEALDHDRNVGFDEVTIYVGVDAPETTGGDESGSGGDSDSGSGSDSDGGTSGTGGGGGSDSESSTPSGSDTDGQATQDSRDDGGCSTAPAGGTFGMGALLMLGFGLIRRRSNAPRQ